MIQITQSELNVITEFLEYVRDEFEQLANECDAVLNSGAIELLEEAEAIILPLQEAKDE